MRSFAIAVIMTLAACGQSTSAPAPTPPSGPQYENAQIIIERLPLIDACLALLPDQRSVIIDPGLRASLRLGGETGPVDCVLADASDDPANATILPALEDLPADAVHFIRGPGENPGGECYEAPEVRGADGELLGWVLDPEGC